MKSEMKSVNVEVKGLFEPLDHLGVAKRIGALPGVHHAHSNPASAGVTVHYDAAVVSEPELRESVRECSHHCRGEVQPDYVCRLAEPDTHAAHAKHAAQSGAMDDMAHDMGHGAGMDMAGMVRDMRNRFLVCLFFRMSGSSLIVAANALLLKRANVEGLK